MKKSLKFIFLLMILVLMMFFMVSCGQKTSDLESQSSDAQSEVVTIDDQSSDTQESSENQTQTENSQVNEQNSTSSEQTTTQNQNDTPVSNENKTTQQPQSNIQQVSPSNNSNQQTTNSQNSSSQQQQPTQEQTQIKKTCYLTIECKTILNNMENLTPGKESLVPSDGYILKKTQVTFTEGENVFDVLLRVTRDMGIHMEYEYTPGFGSHYIEGINNLYEFDCGAGSGWMYYVNSYKPNYGVSKYTLKDGDNIEFRYTCDLGFDL